MVRLNPNIPWKTRGNGAVSIKIGVGEGRSRLIGMIKDKEILCFEKEKRTIYDEEDFNKIVFLIENVIKEHARLDDKNTNSGFALFEKKPSSKRYFNAVKNILSIDKTISFLKENASYYKGYNNKRGLIGASASVSWDNSNDKTYELIAYRKKGKWGTIRLVDDESTKMIDKNFSSTFDNYDYKNNHNRIVPSSPCPVLYGIRGDSFRDLINARSIVKSEPVDSWMIFESNQGTDDHLQKKKISEIKPYESVILKGKVCSEPNTIKGGHVIFSIENKGESVDCAAYEPTKEFRNIIRKLIIGDEIEVYGGVREKPLTINLEKIKICNLEEKIEKIDNPICPNCNKHMKSIGKNLGFRCIKCGLKDNNPILKKTKRDINTGFYEVPVCARRHLSKPLKRDL